MKAIIIMGPPGAGKGTQARLIADRLGYIHLDTGAYFESVLYDPANKKNKTIQKERKIFEKGELLDSLWVLKTVIKRVDELAKAKMGVVLSGSPRTFYEAFGNLEHIGLIKALEKGYGKKNISVFELQVLPRDSIKRNSNRLVCSACKSPILGWVSGVNYRKLKNCLFCGGKLRKRTLDKIEVIKNRLKEYERLTGPVIKEIKKRGCRTITINGRSQPYKIHEKIYSFLPKNQIIND